METARFFTRARRIPVLVGRLPDGRALPGGPYTLLQVLSGAGTVLVLANTTEVWAHAGGLMNLALGGLLVAAVVFVMGKVPAVGRNPASWFANALSLYGSPRSGRLRGRPLRVARPRQVKHAYVVGFVAPPAAPQEPPVAQPVTQEQPAPAAPAPASPPAMSSVARLLAGLDTPTRAEDRDA